MCSANNRGAVRKRFCHRKKGVRYGKILCYVYFWSLLGYRPKKLLSTTSQCSFSKKSSWIWFSRLSSKSDDEETHRFILKITKIYAPQIREHSCEANLSLVKLLFFAGIILETIPIAERITNWETKVVLKKFDIADTGQITNNRSLCTACQRFQSTFGFKKKSPSKTKRTSYGLRSCLNKITEEAVAVQF